MGKAPKMPPEFQGEVKKGGGYTRTAPREWTQAELDWVRRLLRSGHTVKEVAESVGRSVTSVSIKVKRLSKQSGSYNAAHVDDKRDTNAAFLEYIQPRTVLDVFAGPRSVYAGSCAVISNDKHPRSAAEYHLDALKFCCLMYTQNQKADYIDLDPFGSAYDCFDLAVKMAQKGLAVTFGELGHKRWKRLDFVRRYYGINSLEDFTLDALVAHVQEIGRRNKKELKVYAQKEWRNIGRVWFTVEPMKITEQWEVSDRCK